jgi:WD40 repeat protein
MIIQRVQSVRQSVSTLREVNIDSERVRDQFIIHLQQCQEDHNILRQIYKRLKLKLDIASQELLPQRIGGGQTSLVEQKRMPTLESVRLAPSVAFHGEVVGEQSVRLRYALNTSTVLCSVQFSPDGTRIAFADGNFVYVVQTSDGDIRSTLPLSPPPETATAHTRALRFSRNGKHLALSGSANDVLFYEIDSQRLQVYKGHQKEVSAIVFSGDGSWLVSGGFDGVIFVWDIATGQPLKKLPHSQGSPDGTIVGIATTPDVPFYAVGFMNGQIGIYNENFDQPMMSFVAHSQILMGLSVSPFDDMIATVSQDQTIKLWTMRGVASCRHTLKGHTDFVLSAAFSPIAPIVVTGSKDQTLRVWHQKTGNNLCTIQAHRNTVFEIDHHPSERVFVSCSGDGVVCVWDYDGMA